MLSSLIIFALKRIHLKLKYSRAVLSESGFCLVKENLVIVVFDNVVLVGFVVH